MKSTSKVRGSMSPLTDLPLTVMLIFRDMDSSKNVCFSVLIAAPGNGCDDSAVRSRLLFRRAKGDVASHGTNAPRMTSMLDDGLQVINHGTRKHSAARRCSIR